MIFDARRTRAVARPLIATLVIPLILGNPAFAQLPALPAPPGAAPAAPAAKPAAPGAAATAATPEVRPSTALLLLPEERSKTTRLNLVDAPLDQVLEMIAGWTGRTMILAPGLNASIRLRSQGMLPVPEALQALETVLNMNNVALVPMGEKFIKVVQTAAARQEGLSMSLQPPEGKLPEADQLISQVVPLKFIEIAEAQPIVQAFLHAYGKIQPLERTNSMLITDTAANLNRVLEILDYMDQPASAAVETRVYELRFAEAAKLASRLNELIAETQAKEEKPRVETPGNPAIPTPPGIIRARPSGEAAAGGSESESATQQAERGVIRGKVKIVADDRTNILFILSRPENFVFFDRIVAVLDRPIDPEISVRVVALEFAKAEEMAAILNEFVGAASQDKSQTGNAATPAATTPGAAATAADARSQALRDFVARRAEQRTAAAATASATAALAGDAGGFGRLSPNTKILADKRTNSLLLMGRKSDLDALAQVIDGLDVMLAQVLIEAVIIEVNLGNTLDYGIDWLQRSMTVYGETRKGASGGLSVREPVMSFGGGTSLGAGTVIDGSQVQRGTSLGDGLTYFTTLTDLNIDAIIRLAASSRDARILSTPVILTTDNTEAKIVIGEERPVVTSTSTFDTGTQTQNFEYRNIGINLTVTPRINPQRNVVMEIKQTADNVGGFEVINGNRVPIITKREISAQVSVANRSTIVLGGLVATDKSKSRTKVPILGDIPILGSLFRFDSKSDTRTELLVLFTPYVLMSPDEAEQETVRLHKNSASSRVQWTEGWSDSALPRMTAAEMEELMKKRGQVVTMPSVREVFPSASRTRVDTTAAGPTNSPFQTLPSRKLETAPEPERLPKPAPVVESQPAPEPEAAPAPSPEPLPVKPPDVTPSAVEAPTPVAVPAPGSGARPDPSAPVPLN